MMRALESEFLKVKRSSMVLWTSLIVLGIASLTPAMLPVLSRPETQAKITQGGGAWAKAVAAGLYEPTWRNAMSIGTQGMSGSWGLLTFALITAYVFGREFKDGTMSASMTLPLRREYTVLAKMAVVGTWAAALTVLSVVLQVGAIAILHPTGFAWEHVFRGLAQSLVVGLMIYLTLPAVAWFAMLGKGYLPPMLFAFAAMMAGTALATTPVSPWFPWNMPIHYVGASWMPVTPLPLTTGSWAAGIGIFVLGLTAVIWRIDHTDIPS